MNDDAATTWKLTLAILALITGSAVYVLIRQHPPALFEPLQISSGFSNGTPVIFGCAPAFLHTFAICLLIGACVSKPSSGLWHGLAWIALATAFEFSQAGVLAGQIPGWLEAVLPGDMADLVAPYWTRGVFDPLDIAAILTGGAIAIGVQVFFLPETR